MRQYNIRYLPILKENSEVVGLVTPESLRGLLRSTDLFKLWRVEEVMARDVTIAPGASPKRKLVVGASRSIRDS
jgi:CBS-domain-containing membrane protein